MHGPTRAGFPGDISHRSADGRHLHRRHCVGPTQARSDRAPAAVDRVARTTSSLRIEEELATPPLSRQGDLPKGLKIVRTELPSLRA